MSRGETYGDIVETTFNTPLVKLNRIVPPGCGTVLVKLEFFNPLQQRQGPHRPGDDRGGREGRAF